MSIALTCEECGNFDHIDIEFLDSLKEVNKVLCSSCFAKYKKEK